eukprot:3470268-Pleurochrysis_carterae.AAC.1
MIYLHTSVADDLCAAVASAVARGEPWLSLCAQHRCRWRFKLWRRHSSEARDRAIDKSPRLESARRRAT